MPHVIVEYSANVEDSVEIGALLSDLHQTMIESGLAEVAALRTRAERRDQYQVADGNPKNAFVHIVVRMREGRAQDALQKLGEQLLAVANNRLDRAYAAHPLALTIEIHEITQLTFRRNTIRKAEKAA
jgi:5-carboxymethyl-2-hydroxymuconate isomerase